MDDVLNMLKKVMPGEEYKCDGAFVTDDAVYVRINGVWTELRPFKRAMADDELERLRERVKYAEESLAIYDEGCDSAYWVKYPVMISKP